MTRSILKRFLLLLLITVAASSFKLSSSDSSSADRTTSLGESSPSSKQGDDVKERQKQSLGRRERKNLEKKQEYDRRRKEWEERYGSLQALQTTFQDIDTPTNSKKNNLSPEETRRLYHSLLPRSLLGLYEIGLMNPEELAPLAYKARIAAKQYARSRCVWTARFATTIFDQYRNVRDKKRFSSSSSSMTWDEIYKKYEAQIMKEDSLKKDENKNKKEASKNNNNKKGEDFAMRVYLRILERSCVTNQAVDRLFLKDDEEDKDSSDYLVGIASQLENDVRSILLGPKDSAKAINRKRQLLKQRSKADMKEEKKKLRNMKLERKARKKKIVKQMRHNTDD
eukprot:CAMPEP_0194253830 /NCGR_PEP_ID=MMETSP0158-20130606/30712_1 /TAXON_ID=33649 /ORGANISM="Thalassionema nitzschioides, Strain L26-B" /LENGTH=338 /DNA_ID=CAMNT_0038991647 /DNA_START=62 /DNA_END=1078 /DNA_ORIENTATION=+